MEDGLKVVKNGSYGVRSCILNDLIWRNTLSVNEHCGYLPRHLGGTCTWASKCSCDPLVARPVPSSRDLLDLLYSISDNADKSGRIAKTNK